MEIYQQIYELVKQAKEDNPMAFVHNIVKPLAHDKLVEHILDCNDCDICNCTKSIPVGNTNASILIIGESATEDQQDGNASADTFNNEHGEVLFDTLEKLNINLDEIYFINSVHCYPHRISGDIQIKRSPTKTERTNCKVFLDYAIKNIEPLMIICLGGVATNGINEEIGKQSISKIRGEYFMYRGIPVMPTYHPGYFLELRKAEKFDDEYIDNLYNDYYNDLLQAFNDFNESFPDLNIYKRQ